MTQPRQLLIVSSPVFTADGLIPAKYTVDGDGINPPIVIDAVPDGTKTMALIMEDPDAPHGTVTHWVMWDIPPANSISEGSQPGVGGLNTKENISYLPPAPPYGQHRYYIHMFALDSSIDLRTGAKREQMEEAIKDHIIASGTIMGRYERPKEKQKQPVIQTH